MDTFDDIQIEDTAGYAAYCAELEYQEYLESPECIDDTNKELQILRNQELEQMAVDFIV
jgi:hypothetical protein